MTTILEQNLVAAPRPARNGSYWLQALLFMLAVVVLTIITVVSAFILLAGIPSASAAAPLAQPDAGPGLQADLTGKVSQEYVNREITANLSQHPITIWGVGEVTQAVPQFK